MYTSTVKIYIFTVIETKEMAQTKKDFQQIHLNSGSTNSVKFPLILITAQSSQGSFKK